MTINPDEPAMPVNDWGNQNEKMFGLTIRAEIASRLMQGLLANDGTRENYSVFAFDAVKAADTLIAELNKP